MILIYLSLGDKVEKSNLTAGSLIIYLRKPARELLEREFYVDLDTLQFSQEDFDFFLDEIKKKNLFHDEPNNCNLLINEERKYIHIRIFNLTQRINSLVGNSEFKIHFDRKVLNFPSLTVLLGANKESAKVFLHDLRDTIYPYILSFYGDERCVSHNKKLDSNLYIRSILLFFITSINCLTLLALSCINTKHVNKNKNKKKNKNKCLVFVRGIQQVKFLERIAFNPIMEDVDFLVFSENKYLFSSAKNIHFLRLSRIVYLYRFIVIFFKSLYSLLMAIFSRNSLSKNRILELMSNFSHTYWNDINSLILDEPIYNQTTVISFEMVGRHSRNIESMCRVRQINLHRFQVASIEPRHVARISSYGKFWTLDELTYQQLLKFFPNEICFDHYISPNLDLDESKYSFNRILFATQPYGVEDNYKIISCLLELTTSNYQIVIRRHPRDKIDYKVRFPKVEYDNVADAIESIACSGIVLSKTSTILQDCYNLGVPYVAILFDDFSRTLDLLFTKINGKSCEDEKGLSMLMKAYMEKPYKERVPVFSKPEPLKIIRKELFI